MPKVINVSDRLVRLGERVHLPGSDLKLSLRWAYDPTALSPDGTVHVSDPSGKVYSHHAADLDLRVVPDDYVINTEKRTRRVRAG